MGFTCRTLAERRHHVRPHRACGMSSAEGCRLMTNTRLTFYAKPSSDDDDTANLNLNRSSRNWSKSLSVI